MDLNIALLPDRKTKALLVDLNKKISQRLPTQISLDESNAIPHLTLYLARFPRRNLIEIGERVKFICSKSFPVTIHVLGARISISGSVMVDCKGPPALRLLHEQIIRTLSDLHEGIADVWAVSNVDLTQHESHLLDEVGYPYGLELWQPHFTVAKINPVRSAKIDALLDGFQAEFIGTKVGLCYSDQKGVVTRVLETFPLQG